MKRWLLAAGLTAAVLAQSAGPALAADLGYDAPPRHGSAYDDPRYADLYGRPPGSHSGPPPPHYGYQPRPPIPSAPVYRDHDESYAPPPPYRRYTETPSRDGYGRGGCTPKDEIQHRLTREGWSGFHAPEVVDRDTAFVKARRPSGRLFEIKLDRCSGDILSARPIEPRFYGPNNYGPHTYGPNTYGEYRPNYRPGWGRTY